MYWSALGLALIAISLGLLQPAMIVLVVIFAILIGLDLRVRHLYHVPCPNCGDLVHSRMKGWLPLEP